MNRGEYAISVKVRNGLLLRAMRDAGYQTAAALAKAAEVNSTEVGKYLNFELPPLLADGELRPSAWKICRTLAKSVEDLWPPQHMETRLARNKAERFCDLSEIDHVLGFYDSLHAVDDRDDRIDAENFVRRRLELLTDNQRIVISRRYGLDGSPAETLEDIAQDLHVTRERVRQIECRAIRRMRPKGGR